MPGGSEGGTSPVVVVLVEPPCLVSGRDNEVAIHLSAPVHAENSHELVVASDGELVSNAQLTPDVGKTISLDLPPVGSCGVYFSITGVAEEPSAKSPCVLSLPAEAAEEVLGLFDRMLGDMKTGYADSPSGLLYVSPGKEPPRQQAWMSQGGSSRQWLEGDTPLREALWAAHFQPFTTDFATLLEGLSAGNRDCHGPCVPMVMYLLHARLWHTASFLLSTCLAYGVPVTLGPFALAGGDVEAQRLRTDFPGMVRGAEGLHIGEGAEEAEDSEVGVGLERSMNSCGSNSGTQIGACSHACNTAASS